MVFKPISSVGVRANEHIEFLKGGPHPSRYAPLHCSFGPMLWGGPPYHTWIHIQNLDEIFGICLQNPHEKFWVWLQYSNENPGFASQNPRSAAWNGMSLPNERFFSLLEFQNSNHIKSLKITFEIH